MDPIEAAPPPASKSTAFRVLRYAVATALVIAVLWSAAWFYVPSIVNSIAGKLVEQKIGRHLSLGHVEFNPWTLELTLDDVVLAGAAAGSPPQLQVKRIHANAAITSLFRLAPVIDNLDVDAPLLRLSRLADGGYDIDDMVQKIAAAPPADHPARFAVHNIVVRAGAIDFIDVPVNATRRIRDLELGIPFLSSLPSEREINVEPHLAFALDGARFDSAAVTAPWSEQGKGEAKIKLDHFDIAPYLVYLPRTLPARPRSAELSADVLLAFERHPKLTLRISGTVEVTGIKVIDASSQELLEAGDIRIGIDDLRPLEYIAHLARIDVEAPHVLAQRRADGRVNLLLAAGDAQGQPVPVAQVPLPTTAASAAQKSTGAAAASSPTGGAPASPAPLWKATLGALTIHAGQLDWRDASTTPQSALALTDFSLEAKAIGWPLEAPVVFKGEGVLGTDKERGKLTFSGQGNAAGATVRIGLDALPLVAARPYLRTLLELPLVGALSADLGVEWKPSAAGPQLRVDARRVSVAALAFGDAKAPQVGIQELEVLDAHIDTGARTATIGQIAVHAPRLLVTRAKAGSWNFEHWRSGAVSAPGLGAATKPETMAGMLVREASPAADVGGGWKLALGDLAVDKARVGFIDLSVDEPVALDLVDFGVQVHGWGLEASRPVPFRVTGKLSAPAAKAAKAAGNELVGSIDVRGELKGLRGGVPESVRASLLLKDLPLHLVDPYLHALADIDVVKAQTSFKGDVTWEQRRSESEPRLHLHGDASVDDLVATSATDDKAAPVRALAMVREALPTRQLLSWKLLSLRGIDVALAPGTAPHVGVAETSLTDFFARLVLDETGRLNLQDVANPVSASKTPVPEAAASAVPAAAAAPNPLAPIFDFGPIVVVNGRVNYNDRFVTPNYRADLSELSGRLGAFGSRSPAPGTAPQLADIEVRGRVQETASLEITGKVNPLAKPLALDLKAKVRDLELSPLSPYAIKYSGYGIERGKMSVDLAYLVKPDGELTASNHIILNQLTFGDKVPGAKQSLPVKLAVALLADSNGVIDLDLPVSGSINDPTFSIGGVVWQIVKNVVAKAVTAPFRALASSFGGTGGEEFSTVEFPAGTAELGAEAKGRLDKVAQALILKPALNLTITGESRLEIEQEAWKRDRLRQIVRAEKRRQAIGGGADASTGITVSEAEYPELLKAVYKRADIVKPKNAIGLTKDLPTSDMESLLLASIKVVDGAMEQLALRRGVGVRDYLASRNLPTSRLFLAAPKTNPEESGWTPRADLKLAIE